MQQHSALTTTDLAHLERARKLALGGWGRVHPNPMVGCVLVRDGAVLGEGHHRDFGGPHAEVVALDAAHHDARGATAYVTLEPCNHTGKTPPCSEALIAAGVERVVFGAADPTAHAAGSAARLTEAGIDVVGPVWSRARARAENPAFFHELDHDRPFVALKLALTLDGRIAAGKGVRTRITGSDADLEVHRLRSGFDAILVGRGTALTDDPRLTVRLTTPGPVEPRRIVLDSAARLPSRAAVLRDAETAPVHVFTRLEAAEADMERLESAGAHVHPVASGAHGLDLGAVLDACVGLGIRTVLCEGGARLAHSLLSGGHVSRLYLFIAPFTLGEQGVPAFGADAASLPWDGFEHAFPPELHGPDTLLVLDREL